MNLFKKFWIHKATNDTTATINAVDEVLPRPASMSFVPSKDVVARAIDLSHTISDYNLLKRTLGQEFGLNDEEVTQILGAVLPKMASGDETTITETDRDPIHNPAEADERPIDNPQPTDRDESLTKNIKSLYYAGYDNQEIAKTLRVPQSVVNQYVNQQLEPIVKKMQLLAKGHLKHDIEEEARSARHYLSLAEQDPEHAKDLMDIASDEIEHQHKLREIENEEENKEAFRAAASKTNQIGVLNTMSGVKKSATNSFKKLWGHITNFGQWGGYRQRKLLENSTEFKKHWLLTKSSRSEQEIYYLAKEMCKMMEKNPKFDPRPYLEGVGLMDSDIVRVLKKAIELQKTGKITKTLPPHLEDVKEEVMDFVFDNDFDPERDWREPVKIFLREKGLTNQEINEIIQDVEDEFEAMENKSQVNKGLRYQYGVNLIYDLASGSGEDEFEMVVWADNEEEAKEKAVRLFQENNPGVKNVRVESVHKSDVQLKKDEPLGDVWELESNEEQFASELLNDLAQQALRGSRSARRQLEDIWDEDWESIKEKLETEGSVWYVWWMDGVHEFMRRFLVKKDALSQHYDIGYKCNLCGQEFVPYTDQQLISHLKTKHPQQFKEVQEAEANNKDVMVWDFFTNIRRAMKSQINKASKAQWLKMAENLINGLQRKVDAHPKLFREDFGEKEARDFEDKLNQDPMLSYADKAEIMQVVYDGVNNLAPHYKSQTNKARTADNTINKIGIGKCPFCGEEFYPDTAKELVNHIQAKHPEKNQKIAIIELRDPSISSSDYTVDWVDEYGHRNHTWEINVPVAEAKREFQREGYKVIVKTQINKTLTKENSMEVKKKKSSEDDVINDVTRTIASQLREAGWTGPIIAWNKNSVKVSSGDVGVIISYDEGSDSYTFTPYKGTAMGTPKDYMFVDDLPLVVDLINEMKKKSPQKTASIKKAISPNLATKGIIKGVEKATSTPKDPKEVESFVNEAKAKAPYTYVLSWWSLGKDMPKNYDNLIIPEIERVTRYIPGNIVKNKIYNYIIDKYDKGIKEGVLESLHIFSDEGTKKIAFKIDDKNIRLELVPEEKTSPDQLKAMWNKGEETKEVKPDVKPGVSTQKTTKGTNGMVSKELTQGDKENWLKRFREVYSNIQGIEPSPQKAEEMWNLIYRHRDDLVDVSPEGAARSLVAQEGVRVGPTARQQKIEQEAKLPPRLQKPIKWTLKSKDSVSGIQKEDDESPAAKLKRQELEEFYAGLLKIVRSDPNWQPRVRRILVDNDFEHVDAIMQWLKEDQDALAQESKLNKVSKKSNFQNELDEDKGESEGVGDWLRNEIVSIATHDFGPIRTREEVKHNVLAAIDDIDSWLVNEEARKQLQDIAEDSFTINDIVDEICEDYDIKKSQTKVNKKQLAYGVEGEIELEAENNFGPFSTREEVENNVLWAIENIKEWLTDKKELAELESIANNPKKIKEIVDRICEDYDIKKSSKNKVEKPGRSVHSAKFDRCVAHVKESGTAENPYAVCTAVLGDEAFKSQNTELSPAEIKLIDREIKKREGGVDMDKLRVGNVLYLARDVDLVGDKSYPANTKVKVVGFDGATGRISVLFPGGHITSLDPMYFYKGIRETISKDTPTTELPNPLEVGRYEFGGHTIHVWEDTKENERYYSVDESPKMFAHEKDARASVMSLK